MKYTFGFLWKEGLTIKGFKQTILFVLFFAFLTLLIIGGGFNILLLSILFMIFGYTVAVTNDYARLNDGEFERDNSSTS